MDRLKKNLVALLAVVETGDEKEISRAFREVTRGCPWEPDEILAEAKVDIECDHGGYGDYVLTGCFAEILAEAKTLLAKQGECSVWGCGGMHATIIAQGVHWETWGRDN